MRLVGIDPGADGALVALHIDDGVVRPGTTLRMPHTPKVGTDLHRVMDWLLEVNPDHVVVERAQSFPGMGVAGAFNYGRGYGELLGLLVALERPHETVQPSVWHRALCGAHPSGGKPAAKARALAVVRQRLPGLQLTTGLQRKPDEGIVDAACIALWGIERRVRLPVATAST